MMGNSSRGHSDKYTKLANACCNVVDCEWIAAGVRGAEEEARNNGCSVNTGPRRDDDAADDDDNAAAIWCANKSVERTWMNN